MMMKFNIQIVIDEQGGVTIEDIIQLDKSFHSDNVIGLSLSDSKQLLKTLQQRLVAHQADMAVQSHRSCPHCHKKHRIKGYHTIQYRTLFGIVSLPSPRFYHCQCEESTLHTFSPLSHWLTEHVAPELKYLETKWASLMAYGLTADLMKDVLPIGDTLNAATIRHHLHNVAQRQEKDLEGKPNHLSGCPREWAKLPKPDKPITVGIDGGYIRDWHHKNANFEIFVGKSTPKRKPSKRFGLVQKVDDNPKRRLMNVLEKQGMQANQQIVFLSDGADNVRDLQFQLYPESEHMLDWFHITMRLTVLNQCAKGLQKSDPERGARVRKQLESAKWYLWHGNVDHALDEIEDCYLLCDDETIQYKNQKKFIKHLDEMLTYIRNNQYLIPNYGEKWRYGETISTAFVESTVNEVVSKRMAKKQQMQWTDWGAHFMLQTRTAVLNNDLINDFERWYPGFPAGNNTFEMKEAA
jgi:hypothetical protein